MGGESGDGLRGHREPRVVLPVLVALLVAVALEGRAALVGREAWLATLHDDAFYYLTLARHVAEGLGPTFDGVHATNGFHPLWLLCLVVLAELVPSVEGLVTAMAALQTLLLVVAAARLTDLVRARLGRTAALAAGLAPVILPGSMQALRGGMESALVFFVLVELWRPALAVRQGRARPRTWLALSVAVLALVLARLEAVLALPVLALWLRPPGIRLARPRRAAPLLLALVPAVAGAALYAVVSHAAFGLAVPVSGLAKAAWAAGTPVGERLVALVDFPWAGHRALVRSVGGLHGADGATRSLYALTVLAAAVALWRARAPLTARLVSLGVGPALAVAALVFVVQAAFVVHLVEWQWVFCLFASALALGPIVAALPGVMRRATVAALALLALARVAEGAASGDAIDGHRYRELLRGARWAAEHVPPGERIGAFNAGFLGYFSGHPVVPLDGLVHDAAYLREVVEGRRGDAYLARERIPWLVDLAAPGTTGLDPLFELMGARQMARRYELVLAGPVGTASRERRRFAAWRYVDPGAPPVSRSRVISDGASSRMGGPQ